MLSMRTVRTFKHLLKKQVYLTNHESVRRCYHFLCPIKQWAYLTYSQVIVHAVKLSCLHKRQVCVT